MGKRNAEEKKKKPSGKSSGKSGARSAKRVKSSSISGKEEVEEGSTSDHDMEAVEEEEPRAESEANESDDDDDDDGDEEEEAEDEPTRPVQGSSSDSSNSSSKGQKSKAKQRSALTGASKATGLNSAKVKTLKARLALNTDRIESSALYSGSGERDLPPSSISAENIDDNAALKGLQATFLTRKNEFLKKLSDSKKGK